MLNVLPPHSGKIPPLFYIHRGEYPFPFLYFSGSSAVEEPFAGGGEKRCGGLLTAVEELFAGGGEERCGGLLMKVSASGGETEGEMVGLNPEEPFSSMKNCRLHAFHVQWKLVNTNSRGPPTVFTLKGVSLYIRAKFRMLLNKENFSREHSERIQFATAWNAQ